MCGENIRQRAEKAGLVLCMLYVVPHRSADQLVVSLLMRNTEQQGEMSRLFPFAFSAHAPFITFFPAEKKNMKMWYVLLYYTYHYEYRISTVRTSYIRI